MGEAFITRRESQSNFEIITGNKCIVGTSTNYVTGVDNPKYGYIDGLDLNKNDYIFVIISGSTYTDICYVKKGVIVEEWHKSSNDGSVTEHEWFELNIVSNERINIKTYPYVIQEYISFMIVL